MTSLGIHSLKQRLSLSDSFWIELKMTSCLLNCWVNAMLTFVGQQEYLKCVVPYSDYSLDRQQDIFIKQEHWQVVL